MVKLNLTLKEKFLNVYPTIYYLVDRLDYPIQILLLEVKLS